MMGTGDESRDIVMALVPQRVALIGPPVDEPVGGPRHDVEGVRLRSPSRSEASSAPSGTGSDTEGASEKESGEVGVEEPEQVSGAFGARLPSGGAYALLGRALFVHTRYLTLHAAKADDDGSADRLACGQLKERTVEVYDLDTSAFRNVCTRCLGFVV